MSKKSVYLETSFISYLTSRPSRDIITAAHQAVTQDWWAKRRYDFDLFHRLSVRPMNYSEKHKMRNDPIVDEIHQVRRAIMQEHNNDLHRLFEHLRDRQQRGGRKVVTRPPRRPASAPTAARS